MELATELELNLKRACRDVTDAFASFDRSLDWYAAASSEGLVSTPIGVFTEWLGE